MNSFEETVRCYVESNRLIEQGAKVLLAVSGGADSVAMLYCLHAMASRIGFEIFVGHVNHQLRGADANRDERYAAECAGVLGVDFQVRRIDVMKYSQQQGLSLETAARELRIEALRDMLPLDGLIATAHHKDDNVETLLQRMARGTGFRGLCGIWPRKEFSDGLVFIRPMLCVGRLEIETYLKALGVRWCEDATNRDLCHRRNYIRHRLRLVVERDCQGSLREVLFSLSRQSQQLHERIRLHADAFCKEHVEERANVVKLDGEDLLRLFPEVAVEVIRRALRKIGCGEQAIVAEHFESIFTMLQKGEGNKRIELPRGFVALLEHGKLILCESSRVSYSQEPMELAVCGAGESAVTVTRIGDFEIAAKVFDCPEDASERLRGMKEQFGGDIEWFDYDRLCLPIVVRNRREGDRFVPFGSRSEVKVGAFLTDQKIPHLHREKVFVVEDRERIVWVGPIRASNTTRITKKTRKVLELRICS